MSFDFSTLPELLESLRTHAEKIRNEMLSVYGGRNIGPFDDSPAKLWTKKLRAIDQMHSALMATKDVRSFNRAVITNFSEIFTFQRKSSSTSLTNTEKLLCKLRKVVNDDIDDQLIVVMHCLLQRKIKLTTDIERLADDPRSGDAAYTAISEECEALEDLIKSIKLAVERTQYISPMVFYVEIVAWEKKLSNDPTKIVSQTFFSAYREKDISMIKALKCDLLKQACSNGDITPAQQKTLYTSAKISKQNEIEQLAIICPVFTAGSSFCLQSVY